MAGSSPPRPAPGALREPGEEEDGFITDDGDGLRIRVADGAYELELVSDH